mmetsp:Transcript_14489/g.43902  ORF Transcript_14489/g.43902 Transcript_14489/m.43902 type:complete len:420 (-) Transcript_14489:62-1321(-)
MHKSTRTTTSHRERGAIERRAPRQRRDEGANYNGRRGEERTGLLENVALAAAEVAAREARAGACPCPVAAGELGRPGPRPVLAGVGAVVGGREDVRVGVLEPVVLVHPVLAFGGLFGGGRRGLVDEGGAVGGPLAPVEAEFPRGNLDFGALVLVLLGADAGARAEALVELRGPQLAGLHFLELGLLLFLVQLAVGAAHEVHEGRQRRHQEPGPEDHDHDEGVRRQNPVRVVVVVLVVAPVARAAAEAYDGRVADQRERRRHVHRVEVRRRHRRLVRGGDDLVLQLAGRYGVLQLLVERDFRLRLRQLRREQRARSDQVDSRRHRRRLQQPPPRAGAGLGHGHFHGTGNRVDRPHERRLQHRAPQRRRRHVLRERQHHRARSNRGLSSLRWRRRHRNLVHRRRRRGGAPVVVDRRRLRCR